MASRWFCRVFGREMGPLGFQDLAEMVRSGTLKEDDPVRRDGSSSWTPAGEVIGLFRAAERPRETAPTDAADKPKTAPPPRAPSRAAVLFWALLGKVRHPGKGGVIFASSAVTVIVTATMIWGWWSNRTPRFPEHRLGKPPPPVDAMASRPRPQDSSAPGLKKRTPALVPGLEDVDPAFSPCLTSDLSTIVFSAPGNRGADHDLYMATREDVSRPFGSPELIQACVSPKRETCPTLSPDGLELVFTRSEVRPRFSYCARANAMAEFGEPVDWRVPWIEYANQHVERAQFLDALHLALCAMDYAEGTRLFFKAGRIEPSGPFTPAGKIPFPAALPSCFFLATDELRVYYATAEGIYCSARRSTAEPFGQGTLVIEADVTGPIKGPIWVAPQEDVIFYCSPGPGKGLDSSRKLWLIRF